MKKEILVIGLSSILGGVETYIYNMVKYMDLNRYNFDFLIVGNNKSVFEEEINSLINDGSNHFYYSPNLKQNYFAGTRWLKKFYKDHSYDIIYLNTCTAARVQYCMIPVSKGAMLIAHSHNADGKSKVNNAVFRTYINRNSSYKLSCSDLAGEWLYGKKSKDFNIVPNGVDTKRFIFDMNNRKEIRNRLGINIDEIVIGHVGRFSAQKNQCYFIQLAEALPEKYRFLFLGDGEDKEIFLSKVQSNGLEKKFIVLPSSNEVEKYYSAMDIFIMPSIYEGLPIVAVEAQTNGLSCIFSLEVSRQADLSEHCKFLGLDGIETWVTEIRDTENLRYDGVAEIKKRKFDIESTVTCLNEIFNSSNNTNN